MSEQKKFTKLPIEKLPPSFDPYSLLEREDRAQFDPAVGLRRKNPVDPKLYGGDYYSAEHMAYAAEGYNFDERVEKYAEPIKAIAAMPQPIVDLGCGPGFLVEALQRQGVAVEGVDISAKAVFELSLPTTRRHLHVAPLVELPFADGQFASGYSFHVLEHLTESELRQALAEISRVVRDRLHLIIPTWDSAIDETRFKQIVEDPTHRLICLRSWWIEQFKQLGWVHNDEMADQLDTIKRGWIFVFDREKEATAEVTPTPAQ